MGGTTMAGGDQGDAPAGSRIVVVAVLQFAVVGLLALLIVAVTTGIASRRVGQREAVANARTSTVLKAQSVVAPAITDGVRRGDPAALARLDQVVRDEVLDDAVVRVKLWDQTGRIVYSDAPELIGSTYELGEDELEAMRTGRIVAEVSDLSQPENRFEREYGKLLEVYLPIDEGSDDPLLFEAYHRYDAVSASGSQLWRSFAPISLGGLVVLELVQIPLAFSLARRLRDRMREREALSRRALEASEMERRQIAADLHDGVVQELTGVAYALSAAARRDGGPPAPAEVEAAAGNIRDAVRDLRSMVVDLVPVSVDEGGLTAALEELGQRMSTDRLAVTVRAEELPDDVPNDTARVLYRAAQEGLRNAVRHAGAASVAVDLTCDDGHAVLAVTDDGKGFDPATLGERAAEGHVGLRVLRGLVTDAGGSLELATAVGTGTTLRVEVPVA
jgi:signal transduction histidine kinase